MNLYELQRFARELLVIFGLIVIAVAAGCVLSLVLSTTKADAQELTCVPFNDLRASLEKSHEVELSGGLVNERAVVIIFGTPDGSTWTAVAVGVDGKACIIANGAYWFQADLKVGEAM